MTQPTVPPKDDKADQEKANLSAAAGEQEVIASKEAKAAEAEATNKQAKADEVDNTKTASKEKEAKKKAKADKKAVDKAARAAVNPPRVYETREPSARPPKQHPWTDEDEMNLLLTPVKEDESPQMLELRRIALLNQSANLVNAKKHLKKLADEEEYQRHPDRISVKNNKTQRRLNELEDDEEDPAIRRVNKIDWLTYPTK